MSSRSISPDATPVTAWPPDSARPAMLFIAWAITSLSSNVSPWICSSAIAKTFRSADFQQLLCGVLVGIAVADDLGGAVDQLAADRLLAHDPGVILGVGRVGTAVDDLGQRLVAADLLELVAADQLVGQGDRVDPLAQVVHVADRLVDRLVHVAIEVRDGQDRHDLVQDVVVAAARCPARLARPRGSAAAGDPPARTSPGCGGRPGPVAVVVPLAIARTVISRRHGSSSSVAIASFVSSTRTGDPLRSLGPADTLGNHLSAPPSSFAGSNPSLPFGRSTPPIQDTPRKPLVALMNVCITRRAFCRAAPSRPSGGSWHPGGSGCGKTRTRSLGLGSLNAESTEHTERWRADGRRPSDLPGFFRAFRAFRVHRSPASRARGLETPWAVREAGDGSSTVVGLSRPSRRCGSARPRA